MEPSKNAIRLTDMIPMLLSVNVEVPATFGALGQGSVALNDRPFILTGVRHQILTYRNPAAVPPVLADNFHPWFFQDGFYTLDWSLYEQARYWKGAPPMADVAFGSVKTGIWIPLPAPVSMPGNDTLNVNIRNMVDRTAYCQKFTVNVIFDGVQKGGSVSQAQGLD
jgi:hypothetical protein